MSFTSIESQPRGNLLGSAFVRKRGVAAQQDDEDNPALHTSARRLSLLAEHLKSHVVRAADILSEGTGCSMRLTT